VAVYQVPLQEAIWVTGATCSAVGLYQRLGRLRKQNARLEEDRLYKNGLIIANAQVVLEAAKRIAVLDAKAKANAELKKTNDVLK